jgi:hypothetical protein
MILSNLDRYHIRLISLPVILVLAGCNLFSTDPQPEPGLNVTQAYQTVEARLTEVIGLTPQITNTRPTEENGVEPPVATTPPAGPTPTPPITQTVTPSPTPLCDHASPGSPIDVTIPDDSLIEANQAFTKTWRLHNIGSCTWDESYSLVWFSGDQLGAPPSTLLQGSVPPGAEVDVSVDMVAPEEPGTYQSHWKLRNPAGVLFGIGPNADSSFWVRIQVIEPMSLTPSPTPTQTATPTPTPTVGAYASGRITLNLDDRLDLDTLQVNSGSGEDVIVTTGDQIYLLQPLGSALLAIFGNNQPSLEDCQNYPLSPDPVVMENLNPGVYLCYRTNMSLPGWARLEHYSADPVLLELEIYTWAIP